MTPGGSVAITFIVTLAASIVALGVVYLGSAVVVLERFARTAARPGRIAAAGWVIASAGAWIQLHESRPEIASLDWAEWGRALLATALVWWAATALAVVTVRLGLARVAPATAGMLAVGLAALAALLLAGASGAPVVAALPALVVVGASGVRALWRRRTADGAGKGELRRALALAAALALAVPLALLSPAARAPLHAAGVQLLALLGAGIGLGLLPLAAAGFLEMRGSAEWFIATRYLVARRRQIFISAITAICVLGIAVGVWLPIVVLSVMNGFEQTWREEILGDRAHFVVESSEGSFGDWPTVLARVRGVDGVVAAAPFVDADAMVRGRGGEIYSVRLRGVDPESVSRVTRLREQVVAGSLDDVAPADASGAWGEETDRPGDPGLLIGSQLAAVLGIGVGDPLLVISPFGGPPTPLGPAPRLARFGVVGVFRSSAYQYDEAYAYASLESVQDFRRTPGVIDGIEGLTSDYYRSAQVGAAVASRLGAPFVTRDWKDYFPAFFQALKTERVMMFVLLMMIMVVAAFVIVATLIMMIMEKSNDIAILKAMGAEDSLIERVFALEGTLIGLLGTCVGVLAGLAVVHRLSWIQDRIEALTGIDALPSSVYQFSALPSRVDPLQIGVVVAIAMVFSLGATLLPSRQGARLDPAAGLRHE